MSARLLMNYPQEERISTQVLDLLYAELLLARSAGRRGEPHTIWFVSPWISESTFDLSLRGPMHDVFPGYGEAQLPLSAVIKKFLDYGSRVHIVCKPPHQLIGIRSFYRYVKLQRQFRQLQEQFTTLEELEAKISAVSPEKRLEKEQIQLRTRDLQVAIGRFRTSFEKERRNALGRIDVLELLQELKSYRPDQVSVFYNSRVHAKVILGQVSAVYGSANITFNGFNNNDELSALVSDPKALTELRSTVIRMANGHPSYGERWQVEAEQYSIARALVREIEEFKLRQILETVLPSDMRHALELVGLNPVQPQRAGRPSDRPGAVRQRTKAVHTEEPEPETRQIAPGPEPPVSSEPADGDAPSSPMVGPSTQGQSNGHRGQLSRPGTVAEKSQVCRNDYRTWGKLSAWRKGEESFLSGRDRRNCYALCHCLKDGQAFRPEEPCDPIALLERALAEGYTPDCSTSSGYIIPPWCWRDYVSVFPPYRMSDGTPAVLKPTIFGETEWVGTGKDRKEVGARMIIHANASSREAYEKVNVGPSTGRTEPDSPDIPALPETAPAQPEPQDEAISPADADVKEAAPQTASLEDAAQEGPSEDQESEHWIDRAVRKIPQPTGAEKLSMQRTAQLISRGYTVKEISHRRSRSLDEVFRHLQVLIVAGCPVPEEVLGSRPREQLVEDVERVCMETEDLTGVDRIRSLLGGRYNRTEIELAVTWLLVQHYGTEEQAPDA